MLLKRVFDATELNKIVNRPSVFSWVALQGMSYMDLSPVAENPANVILMTKDGGFMFVYGGQGVYEVHTQFLPTGAKVAMKAAKEAARRMFEVYQAKEITTCVPRDNERAKRLTLAMGFTLRHTQGVWTYVTGDTAPLDWYSLTKEEWECQQQSPH